MLSILLGIKAGMFVRDAKALCPDLVIFPYNFEAYEEVRSSWMFIVSFSFSEKSS